MAIWKTTWIVFIAVLIASGGQAAYAVTKPNFPSCTNPQGVLKIQYSDGIHGIAGNSANYSGSDSVYTLTEETLLQCFCAQDGQGIQSNWWKVSSLSQAEINILKRDGWVFVVNGLVWGLDDAPYLVRNGAYDCPAGGGEVAGAVLGWAATGNTPLVSILAIAGSTALLIGVWLKRKA